jgi:hypothetical protein
MLAIVKADAAMTVHKERQAMLIAATPRMQIRLASPASPHSTC